MKSRLKGGCGQDWPPHIGVVLFASLLAACGSSESASQGQKIYQERCSTCHNSIEAHAPMLGALKQMPAKRILAAMDFGVMMNVAYILNRSEREAVANWLGIPDVGAPPAEVN
jgi:mono/diheme cytochrome c family protein